ncbi:hypothetical protein GCM10023334_122550 [Nonomuraea thailandensis]
MTCPSPTPAKAAKTPPDPKQGNAATAHMPATTPRYTPAITAASAPARLGEIPSTTAAVGETASTAAPRAVPTSTTTLLGGSTPFKRLVSGLRLLRPTVPNLTPLRDTNTPT